jgi:hypothetical protein
LGFNKQVEQRIESINKRYAQLDKIEMPAQNVDLENETANELKKGPQTKRTTINVKGNDKGLEYIEFGPTQQVVSQKC